MFSASRGFPSLKLPNNKKRSELLVRQLRPFYFSSYSFSSLAQVNGSAGLDQKIDARRQLQSLFATAQLGYNEFVYLDLSARSEEHTSELQSPR